MLKATLALYFTRPGADFPHIWRQKLFKQLYPLIVCPSWRNKGVQICVVTIGIHKYLICTHTVQAKPAIIQLA